MYIFQIILVALLWLWTTQNQRLCGIQDQSSYYHRSSRTIEQDYSIVIGKCKIGIKFNETLGRSTMM
jgi:hypothetical protein